MKKRQVPVEQYSYETKNIMGPSQKYLDKTAPLIGYIVHSFNSLEECLNDTICDLFFDDSHALGLQAIYKRTYADKVDLFKRLIIDIQTGTDKTMPVFEELIASLIAVGQLRNMVIHADWQSAHDDGYTLCKVKMSASGLQQEYVQFTVRSLKKILSLTNKTHRLFDKYIQQLPDLYR